MEYLGPDIMSIIASHLDIMEIMLLRQTSKCVRDIIYVKVINQIVTTKLN